MNDEKSQSDQDKELFRRAMKGVKPIDTEKRIIKRNKAQASIEYRRQAASKELKSPQTNLTNKMVMPGKDYLFSRSGVQAKQLKRLKQGLVPIQAKIDLHGMTLAEAESALSSFFDDCVSQHYRCIKIIHGKGKHSKDQLSSLQNLTYQWLEQQVQVIAFCSAHTRHGGTGATYVLLKQTRQLRK